MIKIRYSKKRLKSYFLLGLFMIIIGILFHLLSIFYETWSKPPLNTLGIGQVSAGICFWVISLFENTKQYLTIKNEVLIKHTLFSKKINLNDITEIREFAGDLKLITNQTEFVIDTQIADPDSLQELKKALKQYNKAWS